MTAIVLFLCALPGFVLARLSAVAPVIFAAALFAVPADEARAHNDNSATLHAETYPLHAAVGTGDLDSVNHFITVHMADVNGQGVGLLTPLHYTALNGHATIAATLIAAGADVNAKAQYNITPMYRAAEKGHVSIISILIASGANVNAKTTGGSTPLNNATRDRRFRMAVISMLIAAGGHWGEPCENGFVVSTSWRTPCICNSPKVKTHMGKACMSADHAPLVHSLDDWQDAIRANDTTLIAHFIAEHGQDPDEDYGLHSTVGNGYHLAARVLIEGGANVDLRQSGETPLHLAVRSEQSEMITLLLNRGANASIADDDGDTPLHLAARRSDTPENAALVSFLLDKGADPNIFNNRRWRPLDLADGRDGYPRRRKIMSALIAGGANWSDECVGGKVPNEFTPPKCKCPAHLSIDNNGLCECPAHSHSQVNGLCLPKDSAQVEAEIAKMQVELARLRAALVSLNARLSLSAEAPRETVEDIAEQARETAAEIDWRRANFVALGRRAEAGEAPPPVALSDTAAECRMRGGEVRIDSGSGTRICLGLDQSGTFCLVDSGGAFPCRGLFKHVRRCNDVYHRPALNAFICGARCGANETARGRSCE